MKPSATGYDQPQAEMDALQRRRRLLHEIAHRMKVAAVGTRINMQIERDTDDDSGSTRGR